MPCRSTQLVGSKWYSRVLRSWVKSGATIRETLTSIEESYRMSRSERKKRLRDSNSVVVELADTMTPEAALETIMVGLEDHQAREGAGVMGIAITIMAEAQIVDLEAMSLEEMINHVIKEAAAVHIEMKEEGELK